MLITDVLEELGYTVIDAADSVTGLKLLQSNIRIDLLVSDVGLPGGMNGRQMADAARESRPDLRVLFITGYAENFRDQQRPSRARHAGDDQTVRSGNICGKSSANGGRVMSARGARLVISPVTHLQIGRGRCASRLRRKSSIVRASSAKPPRVRRRRSRNRIAAQARRPTRD
jgi:CheY-like chemotaxis protein